MFRLPKRRYHRRHGYLSWAFKIFIFEVADENRFRVREKSHTGRQVSTLWQWPDHIGTADNERNSPVAVSTTISGTWSSKGNSTWGQLRHGQARWDSRSCIAPIVRHATCEPMQMRCLAGGRSGRYAHLLPPVRSREQFPKRRETARTDHLHNKGEPLSRPSLLIYTRSVLSISCVSIHAVIARVRQAGSLGFRVLSEPPRFTRGRCSAWRQSAPSSPALVRRRPPGFAAIIVWVTSLNYRSILPPSIPFSEKTNLHKT